MSAWLGIGLGVAAPLLAAWSLGRWLLAGFLLPASVSLGVGSALLSLAVFALLACGLAKPPAFALLTALSLLPLWRRPPRVAPPRLRWTWLWAPAAAYGLLYLIHALAPEIQTDALNYHLTLAIEARSSGGMPSRRAFYDVLPQGMEALFAFAYAFGGEPAAKLLHYAFLIATAELLVATCQSLGMPAGQGALASLFYAATPVVGVAATCAMNDAAMAFYVLATFYLAVVWRKDANARLAAAAGLCAGFCFAIKFPGAIMPPALLLLMLSRRRWKSTGTAALAAALCPLPWLLRAAILTGNPFAPLLNRLFPNPYFHIETEQRLADYLSNYGDVEWQSIGLELTILGDALQGLLGPAWLAAPLALLALRRPEGRWLAAGAVLAATPWLFNIGTRFLIPALPFVAALLMAALPRLAATLLLGVHLLTSWPAIIPLYAPAAWALPRTLPWRAALGLEDRAAYQRKWSDEFNIAELLKRHTPAGSRILDLANAPAAITPRELINAWQSALGDRLVHAMQIGASPDAGLLVEWKTVIAGEPVRAFRFRYLGSQREAASIQEIEFSDREGKPLHASALWQIAAWPNVWESPFALDRNLTTGWRTWEAVQSGMFIEVEFPAPVVLSEVRVIAHSSARRLPVEAAVLRATWERLALPAQPHPRPGLNLRQAAMRAVNRAGIRYVLAAEGVDGFGLLGKDIAADPWAWGLEAVARFKHVALYALR